MSISEEKEPEEEKIKELKETDIEKQLMANIRDWDLIDSYKYFRNYITNSSVIDFVAKKKCVEFGKELMPMNLNKKSDQEEIESIYKDACKVLNEARPKNRVIKLTFQDFGEGKVIPTYKISATDVEVSESREEEFDRIFKNFLDQQYECQIEKLQEVDNKIFHELVKHKVIKTHIPTVDELIDDMIRIEFKGVDTDGI